ncbi:putative replication protein A, OB [Helianthus annuus]|nr:putative replication protein A, OB [Helianthus annuus]
MSFKNENEIYALEMLVVDEEGTRRQGTCLKTFLKKFGPLLQEGSTVIIKNPTLGDNLSSFKYVDCPHKICLYYDSKVIKCNDFLGSDNGFSFTPFSSILDKTFQNTQPIDVIGDVCVCYDTESFTGKNGKESVKRTMQLEDKEGNKIYVTLWDSYVHQFNDYISQNPGVTRVVLIIQFGKLSWFKDKPYVSNSYTVTKVFINHDFSEIQEFKTSKSPKESASGSVSGSQRSTGSIFYSFRDDFLVHTDFKKMLRLLSLKSHNKLLYWELSSVLSKRYPGSMTHAPDVTARWFLRNLLLSFHLEKKKHGSVRVMYVLNKKISCVQRFKIPLRVQDATGMISLTLFEKDAIKIFKKTAQDMYQTYLEGGYKGFIPDDFESLYEKKYAFKIDVTKYNTENDYPFYGILKLSNDLVIVTELEDRFQEDQDQGADTPFNCVSNNLISEDTSAFKGTVSYTGDNQTPNDAADKSIGKRPVSSESNETKKDARLELKRNLKEVYDVEDNDCASATKASPTIQPIQVQDGKFDFLIPKLEK